MKNKYILGTLMVLVLFGSVAIVSAWKFGTPSGKEIGIKCGNAAAMGRFAISDCNSYCEWQGKNRNWGMTEVTVCKQWAQKVFKQGPPKQPAPAPAILPQLGPEILA
jgi:hypothetical protein